MSKLALLQSNVNLPSCLENVETKDDGRAL